MSKKQSLADVLTEVSRIYLEGTTEFYAKLQPNPWQEAHDQLGSTIERARENQDAYFEEVGKAGQIFIANIRELIERYRPFSTGRVGDGAIRGLYSNSEGHAEAKASLATKTCGGCGTDKEIKIKNHPKHGPGIYCAECWKASLKK